MKRIKEILFKLLIFLAIISTMLSMCCDGSLGAIFILWGITAFLWGMVSLVYIFSPEEEPKTEYKIGDLQRMYSKRAEMKREATPEDFEECYRIAIGDKVNQTVVVANKEYMVCERAKQDCQPVTQVVGRR